jgi:hypothetical protein
MEPATSKTAMPEGALAPILFNARWTERAHSTALPRAHLFEDIMSTVTTKTGSLRTRRRPARHVVASLSYIASLVIASTSLTGLATTVAHACACGCSVFDVGGGLLPQENDHGGRVFMEYWYSNQTQNWIGAAKASPSANTDKNLNTSWYSVGFSYNFNRDWGVFMRIPTATRSFTTDTGAPPGGIGMQTFNSNSLGDIEIDAMYTGFFNDMSTGVMFGLKLPTGSFTTPGLDRDNQLGTGSTDLVVNFFHRGMITGDNAWQYYDQIRFQQPFAYQAAADPQGYFDGNPGVVQTYKPGLQVDGAFGILYNNLYNVLGFDKITPLGQVIISHRNHDDGTGADPLNSGFDRVMLSPGVELTKVIDEANNRVMKFYADIEIPVYYRTNAGFNGEGLGQLIAPYMVKVVTSYNF